MPVVESMERSSEIEPKQTIITFALLAGAGTSMDRSIARIADAVDEGAEIVIQSGNDQEATTEQLRYVGDRLREELTARGRQNARVSIERAEGETVPGQDKGVAVLVAVSQRR
jgi:hypothetical protein